MVKTEQNLSSSTIKQLLPTVKNRARKTQLMLKLKFDLSKQKKKERELRKKERQLTCAPVTFTLAFAAENY